MKLDDRERRRFWLLVAAACVFALAADLPYVGGTAVLGWIALWFAWR